MTPPTLNDILRATADRYGVSVEDMQGRSKCFRHAHPRQTAMYLSRTLTKHSLPRIGKFYSRDHTTVIHAMRRVTQRLTANQETRDHVATIIFWLCRGPYRAGEHGAARAIADSLVIFGIYRHALARKPLTRIFGNRHAASAGMRV